VLNAGTHAIFLRVPLLLCSCQRQWRFTDKPVLPYH
jgi:hypothetical protein